MKKILFTLLFLNLFSLTAKATDLDDFFNKSNIFFGKYVVNNKVDYETLQTKKVEIEELFTIANKIQYGSLETDQFKAFWINIYNLCVIKELTARYPIKSPLDVPGLFNTITFTVGQNKFTLDQIEKDILSATFNDSRIHFALVCGAMGCPPLLNKAYFPEVLDKMLDEQTKVSLNNAEFLRLDTSSKKVQISQIFEWYKQDFITSKTSEIDFINRYRDQKISKDFQMTFYTYDWAINKSK